MRECTHVDYCGAKLGELTLGEVRMTSVEGVSDDQAEHRVTEKLQPLIGGQATMLVGKRSVRERTFQQRVVDSMAERRLKLCVRRGPRLHSGHLRDQTSRTCRRLYVPQVGQA